MAGWLPTGSPNFYRKDHIMKRKTNPWIDLACWVLALSTGFFYFLAFMKLTEMIVYPKLCWVVRILGFPSVFSLWIATMLLIGYLRERMMYR